MRYVLILRVESGIYKYQRILLKVNINNTVIAGIKDVTLTIFKASPAKKRSLAILGFGLLFFL